MKTKFLALMLLAGGSLFAAPRVFFGVGVGPAYGGYYVAPPPPAYAYAAPVAQVAPYPGGVYINGYWNFYGGRYAWQPGYYARPPYAGATWYGPRYHGGRYYGGYWGHRR